MIRYLIKACITFQMAILGRLYSREKSNILILNFEIFEVIGNHGSIMHQFTRADTRTDQPAGSGFPGILRPQVYLLKARHNRGYLNFGFSDVLI